ncbi:MAG: GNAT family N-acetyltransferase [Promethearchaeota archaeon]|nr:MAG: GNAT family N-acetyltransferase [Candidatus Lokiarchaeota archaeon]
MSSPKIEIKLAGKEDFIELKLCAMEFLDFIKDFKKKFFNKKFFILTAYYDSILAGILVGEDEGKKIDSIEKIVPIMYLHLLFVNPKFRHKNIGKALLDNFKSILKKKGIASIYVKLPQKYKKGVEFFQKNNFHQVDKNQNRIILELNLWNDLGIRDCQIIGDNFDNMLS